tara:strand:- start:7870 stop:8745 length:876 start_codon:yes stop_codon:yes gene_type:complete
MLRPLLAALLSIMVSSPALSHDHASVSVMSFNIRYGTANDGGDRWPLREDLALGVFEQRQADVVGVQEALGFQIDAITNAHAQYGVVGVGRDDGRTKGEFSAILYRTDRFAVDASGTFWLSDTPDVIASATWGNGITRICTWARLIERASGRALYVFNTHFDHQSQPSRERSARLIAERIAVREHADPVVLMGDFNAGEANPAMTFLTERGGDAAGPGLIDTYRVIHPDEPRAGTFNAFRGDREGERIDAILVSEGIRVLDADIDRTNTKGRYPSDHFPVWAVIGWPSEDE